MSFAGLGAWSDASRPVNSDVMSLTSTERVADTSDLSFDVQDAWELNICTCCSNSYLLALGPILSSR
jgi:hypothetical protein